MLSIYKVTSAAYQRASWRHSRPAIRSLLSKNRSSLGAVSDGQGMRGFSTQYFHERTNEGQETNSSYKISKYEKPLSWSLLASAKLDRNRIDVFSGALEFTSGTWGLARQSFPAALSTTVGLGSSFPSLGNPSQLQIARPYHHLSYGGSSKRYHSTEAKSDPKAVPQEAPQGSYRVKIPTPKSAPSALSPLATFDPQALLRGLVEMTWSLTKMTVNFLVHLPGNIFFYTTHGKERKDKIQEIKDLARKEFDHYWTGTKLLMADVRTARELVARTLSGSALTRRERKQLLRTVTDLFRVVPFSMFVLIPLAEFVLPIALRLFPNMLPSTFQDSLKAEENMKRELQSRIAMAQFFQETLEELAKEQKRIAATITTDSPERDIATRQEESAASMLEFLDRARHGDIMPADVIIQYANLFRDDLTLDNMPRMQLVNMCKYMSMSPYGADAFLRFQLRHRIRILKEDDQRILWEGIDSLTKMELREACQERGMRSTGLSKEAYKKSLQQWLDLSVNKNVPVSLLVMSRTFYLQEEMTTPVVDEHEAKSVAGLADAISGLDKEVLNEVILEVATTEEKKSNPDIRKIKLEVVTHQNEKIREEREAAEKKKKAAERVETMESDEGLATAESTSPSEDWKQTDTTDASVDAGSALPEDPQVKENVVSEEEKDKELSADEMEAITQLLSADPVSKEREDLEKIKSAMVADEEKDEEASSEPHPTPEQDEAVSSTVSEDPDQVAAEAISRAEKQAAEEASKSTVFTTSSTIEEPLEVSKAEVATETAEPVETVDPVVAGLKKRVESMVNKIESQLSVVELKIGDKLHMLDKDNDGILSREEVAEALHLVLKREISFDEAMEIADEIDENSDGLFTVKELITWIETNKLIKLESEGRDADMDRIMETHLSDAAKEEEQAAAALPDSAPPARKTEDHSM